jgi:hypothetical protein
VSDHDETTVEPSGEVPVEAVLPPPPDPLGDTQRRLAQQLVEQVQAEGINLVALVACWPISLKAVLKTGLEVEMDEHLGYVKHDRRVVMVATAATARAPRR